MIKHFCDICKEEIKSIGISDLFLCEVSVKEVRVQSVLTVNKIGNPQLHERRVNLCRSCFDTKLPELKLQ